MKVSTLNVDGIDNDRNDAAAHCMVGRKRQVQAVCARRYTGLTVKVSLASHMIRSTRFVQNITRRWWKVPNGTKSYRRVAKTSVKGDAFGAGLDERQTWCC